MDISKTIGHHFPDFHILLETLDDPRKCNNYSITEIVHGAISLFLFKCGSRNAFDNLIGERKFRKNYKKMFGIRIPKLDTVADVLKLLPEKELENLKNRLVHILLKKRVFDNWRYKGKLLIALDGSGITSYKEQHCQHCLFKIYNKGKDNEKKVWYHNVLEAKLVTSNGFSISLATVWIENPDKEYNKQDCERKAFERMAIKLKKEFPRTSICILADGLYPYDNFFNICKQNNWNYIVTLKEKSLKNLWKNIKNKDREALTEQFPEHALQIEQRIQWINKEKFNDHTHNWIQIDEKGTNSKNKVTKYKFVYLTDLEVNEDTIKDVCTSGRLRWKIEKQGFDQQKNHGYNICHKYCRNSYTGMKNFYQCCQIAHMINQLVELAKGFERYIPGKKTITHLWECLRAFMMFGNISKIKMETILEHKTNIQYRE